MKALTHAIEKAVANDLQKKMVFLSGPRQVGKTTLARKILSENQGRYLLYDDAEDRETILKKSFETEGLVCLDEFHKYARWKSYLKGLYDKHRPGLHILVTGSARLDVHQKSGDSLFGRYYLHHLHPLTLGELDGREIALPEHLNEPSQKRTDLDSLLRFGGFPEPFLAGSETEHRRWSLQRRQLLINEELRDLSRIQLVSVLENLILILPGRIGSLFSYASLAEELRVSTPTIQNWMEILGHLFYVYKILPYSKKVIRSIRKKPKYYLWDWSQVPDEGARFENFVAGHLWKAVSQWTSLGLANAGLFFLHDRNARETDFVVTKDGEPWFLVEVKLSDEKRSPSLRYFAERFQTPGVQLVRKSGVYRREGNLITVSADRWLGNMA